jgi:transporter family-2 protein
MWLALLCLGVVVGAFLPWQPVINSRLGLELGSPLWAGFVSFLTGALVLGIIVHLQGGALWRWQKLTHVPYWMLTGGILGVSFVMASIFLIPRIGAMGMSVSFILGQLLMSTLMDHFGWFGLPVRSIDPLRITGILLLLAGVWLVVRPAHAA